MTTAAVEQLCFDYESLDPETRSFVLERAERIHNLARMTAASIVKIGQHLTEVKERLKHGKFLGWIEKEFAWSQPTAWRFMNVYEQFKLSNLNNLEIDVSALYMIAAPSFPEPVRAEAIRRAGFEPVSHQAVRALAAHFAETGEMPEPEVTLAHFVRDKRDTEDVEPEESPQDRAEANRLLAGARANSAYNSQVFAIIRAVEAFNETQLTMAEIAAQIEWMDTPDKDWHAQTTVARARIGELCKELHL